MPVFTRIMLPEEYGIYTTFMSWTNLFSIFTSLGIYGNVFNKAMIKFENERAEYISSVQWLTILCVCIFAFPSILLNAYKISILDIQNHHLYLLIIYLAFFPTLQYWYQAQRFEFKYKALVSTTLFISLSNIIFGILSVFLVKEKGTALIITNVFVQTIVGVILFIKIAVKGKVLYKRYYWNWSLKLALPLIPSSLAEILLGHADRIMIRYMCNASMAAIYTTVYQISMVATILRMGINGAYIPWLYYALRNKAYQSIQNVIKIIILLFGGITISVMLLGPELMKFVAPKSYYEAVVDIPAIMLGCFFVSIYYLFEQIEFFYEKVFFSSFVSVIGAIINIILNAICIKSMGYLAAGYTTMFTYGLMAIIHSCYVLYLGKKYNKLICFFDFRYIIRISGMLIMLGMSCIALYKLVSVIRILIVLLLGLFVYVNRDKIKKYLKTFRNIP